MKLAEIQGKKTYLYNCQLHANIQELTPIIKWEQIEYYDEN